MAQAATQSWENWQVKIDKILHQKNAFTDVLEKIEEKTKIRRLYIVMGCGVFMALYLMVGYGADFLCNFIGFLYPAYASVKAIESHAKEDDTKWLTYWVVYSAFSLIEFFADVFLFWIPLYFFFKCGFLIYCFLPVSWNGSLTIYKKIIRPLFLKHQKKVDEALDQAKDLASDVLNEASTAAADLAADATRQRVIDASKTE